MIADDRESAEAAVVAAMSERRFGPAGDAVVIEECLQGPEVSFFAVCDGERAVPIGTAQDHKRVFDEDRGPNTGGMGAFAPSPLVDAALEARVMREIVEPVLAGLAAEGAAFRGFLYVGLMLTPGGPKVIEFNVRLGDPEAQVMLPLGSRRSGSRRSVLSGSCSRRAAIRNLLNPADSFRGSSAPKRFRASACITPPRRNVTENWSRPAAAC